MIEARLLRWEDLFLFAGPLSAVAAHRHRATALLLAGDAPFCIRTATHGWQQTFGAIVPAGLEHELDCDRQPMAVVYFDPLLHGPLAEAAALLLGNENADWVRAGRRLIQPVLERSERADYRQAFSAALREHILPTAGLSLDAARPDPRLLDLRAQLQDTSGWNHGLGQVAAQVGVSRFHFSHLFTAHAGLAWTAYRNWMRMLSTCAALENPRISLTQIALDGGYSSSAHFSAAFRGTFGITPSAIRPRAIPLTASHPTANI